MPLSVILQPTLKVKADEKTSKVRMGASFGSQQQNRTHNVDITYDYRFFFDSIDDNYHKDCLQYIQPYKIEPKENDKKVLTEHFVKLSNKELCQHSKSKDITPSLRCYCLDGLMIRYLSKNDLETFATLQSLITDSIKCVLMDTDTVSLAEGLFGMSTVWMLPFHHILQYLPTKMNHDFETYIFSEFDVLKPTTKLSFIDQMNQINNKEAEVESSDDEISINYAMIFELLRSDALRNKSKQNYNFCHKMMQFHLDEEDAEMSMKYIPLIAMYQNENDVEFIVSLLNKGPSEQIWFAAMKCLEYFQHDTFWNYLLEFFKKIYAHISIVNGETVPINLREAKIENKHKYVRRFLIFFAMIALIVLIEQETLSAASSLP